MITIIKLTESTFFVDVSESDSQIMDWQKLITFLDDIGPWADNQLFDLIAELATYRVGAVKQL
jgi:hypothetical protein